MPSLSLAVAALAAAVAAVSATSIDIAVKASGGNATSGHQYGFLHEASPRAKLPLHTHPAG